MSKALTLRLPDEMHETLRREAFDQRRSITAIIIEALAFRPKPGTLCDERGCWKTPAHITTPGGFHFCDEHWAPLLADTDEPKGN